MGHRGLSLKKSALETENSLSCIVQSKRAKKMASIGIDEPLSFLDAIALVEGSLALYVGGSGGSERFQRIARILDFTDFRGQSQ